MSKLSDLHWIESSPLLVTQSQQVNDTFDVRWIDMGIGIPGTVDEEILAKNAGDERSE